LTNFYKTLSFIVHQCLTVKLKDSLGFAKQQSPVDYFFFVKLQDSRGFRTSSKQSGLFK